MKKTRLVPLLGLLIAIALVAPPPASPQYDNHQCWQCHQIGLTQFCFFGYPGRSNCVPTATFCAMSGAFCDDITVVG